MKTNDKGSGRLQQQQMSVTPEPEKVIRRSLNARRTHSNCGVVNTTLVENMSLENWRHVETDILEICVVDPYASVDREFCLRSNEDALSVSSDLVFPLAYSYSVDNALWCARRAGRVGVIQ